MATIIGFVGGGGIGQILIQYQGLAQWHCVGTIILVVGVVVSLMDYFSMVVRQKLKRG
jgi:phosphonate transport system permease protein